jgi:hypothetical protein
MITSTRTNNVFAFVVVLGRRHQNNVANVPLAALLVLPRFSAPSLSTTASMEGHSTTSQVQVMPRLRLTRQSLSVSGAGPSQTSTRLGAQADLSDDLRASYSVDGDEDEESTPRRAPSDALHPMDDVVEGDGSRSEATPTADTPANRLRALLARSPGSATPTQRFVGRNTAEGNGPSTSQLDYATATPKHPFSPPLEEPPASVARESLRDLFAHALRDPGDTPVKEGRTRRRNSFGSSGISGSPVRTRTRTKRMSFSDEEIDHMSSESFGHCFLRLATKVY